MDLKLSAAIRSMNSLKMNSSHSFHATGSDEHDMFPGSRCMSSKTERRRITLC